MSVRRSWSPRGWSRKAGRRLGWAMAIVLVLGVGAPSPVAAGQSNVSGSPLEWLRGLFSSVASAATSPPLTPVQEAGRAGGPARQVPAGSTRGGRNTAGGPLGVGKGELSGYQPHSVSGTSYQVPRGGESRFDPATSRRVVADSSEKQDVYQNVDGSFTRRVYQQVTSQALL